MNEYDAVYLQPVEIVKGFYRGITGVIKGMHKFGDGEILYFVHSEAHPVINRETFSLDDLVLLDDEDRKL